MKTKKHAPLKPAQLELAAGERVTLVGPLRLYGYVDTAGGGAIELPEPRPVTKAPRKPAARARRRRAPRPYIETLRRGRF